ncbi:hypothetical protein QR680_014297 [Steinernema hermaphroditum]|uniref:Uncharacterized protein n=1 Tax=Steinernema hermaphroditum TaxID=289476 RepID=A0AA39M3Z6_9BILA|nr:hypothetical protein QR680_014297 [Steinernema hermaphroditum]
MKDCERSGLSTLGTPKLAQHYAKWSDYRQFSELFSTSGAHHFTRSADEDFAAFSDHHDGENLPKSLRLYFDQPLGWPRDYYIAEVLDVLVDELTKMLSRPEDIVFTLFTRTTLLSDLGLTAADERAVESVAISSSRLPMANHLRVTIFILLVLTPSSRSNSFGHDLHEQKNGHDLHENRSKSSSHEQVHHGAKRMDPLCITAISVGGAAVMPIVLKALAGIGTLLGSLFGRILTGFALDNGDVEPKDHLF